MNDMAKNSSGLKSGFVVCPDGGKCGNIRHIEGSKQHTICTANNRHSTRQSSKPGSGKSASKIVTSGASKPDMDVTATATTAASGGAEAELDTIEKDFIEAVKTRIQDQDFYTESAFEDVYNPGGWIDPSGLPKAIEKEWMQAMGGEPEVLAELGDFLSNPDEKTPDWHGPYTPSLQLTPVSSTTSGNKYGGKFSDGTAPTMIEVNPDGTTTEVSRIETTDVMASISFMTNMGMAHCKTIEGTRGNLSSESLKFIGLHSDAAQLIMEYGLRSSFPDGPGRQSALIFPATPLEIKAMTDPQFDASVDQKLFNLDLDSKQHHDVPCALQGFAMPAGDNHSVIVINTDAMSKDALDDFKQVRDRIKGLKRPGQNTSTPEVETAIATLVGRWIEEHPQFAGVLQHELGHAHFSFDPVTTAQMLLQTDSRIVKAHLRQLGFSESERDAICPDVGQIPTLNILGKVKKGLEEGRMERALRLSNRLIDGTDPLVDAPTAFQTGWIAGDNHPIMEAEVRVMNPILGIYSSSINDGIQEMEEDQQFIESFEASMGVDWEDLTEDEKKEIFINVRKMNFSMERCLVRKGLQIGGAAPIGEDEVADESVRTLDEVILATHGPDGLNEFDKSVKAIVSSNHVYLDDDGDPIPPSRDEIVDNAAHAKKAIDDVVTKIEMCWLHVVISNLDEMGIPVPDGARSMLPESASADGSVLDKVEDMKVADKEASALESESAGNSQANEGNGDAEEGDGDDEQIGDMGDLLGQTRNQNQKEQTQPEQERTPDSQEKNLAMGGSQSGAPEPTKPRVTKEKKGPKPPKKSMARFERTSILKRNYKWDLISEIPQAPQRELREFTARMRALPASRPSLASHKASPEEHAAADALYSNIVDYFERLKPDTTFDDSHIPRGRLNAKNAMQNLANRERGSTRPPLPEWQSSVVAENAEPLFSLGVILDTSASMQVEATALGKSAFILRRAIKEVGGEFHIYNAGSCGSRFTEFDDLDDDTILIPRCGGGATSVIDALYEATEVTGFDKPMNPKNKTVRQIISLTDCQYRVSQATWAASPGLSHRSELARVRQAASELVKSTLGDNEGLSTSISRSIFPESRGGPGGAPGDEYANQWRPFSLAAIGASEMKRRGVRYVSMGQASALSAGSSCVWGEDFILSDGSTANTVAALTQIIKDLMKIGVHRNR